MTQREYLKTLSKILEEAKQEFADLHVQAKALNQRAKEMIEQADVLS